MLPFNETQVPDPDDSAPPRTYIMSDEVEALARKGLFEGSLTTREVQQLCGAVLAEISTRRAADMFAKVWAEK